MNPKPLFSNKLKSQEGLSHGFFKRLGGISTGIYSSLNTSLGKTDAKENALKNRDLIKDSLQAEHIVFMHQQHGNQVTFIDKNILNERDDLNSPLFCDALVTQMPQIALSVQTADCAPILLYDPYTQIIAAIHAGWRGALSGIVENTLTLMQEKGVKPQNIIAAIGPSISQASYEVSQDVHAAFIKKSRENAYFFIPSPQANHFLFDLPGLVQNLLEKQEVQNIDGINQDTYTNEDLFFSCRRAFHKGDPSFGNQASCIMLKAPFKTLSKNNERSSGRSLNPLLS